jgi:hypothetical protein
MTLPDEPFCFVGEPRTPRSDMPNKKLTKTEPALIRGAIVSALSLLSLLGVSWATNVDKDTIGALAGVAAVVIPLAQAAWTRRAVTPARAIPKKRILGKAAAAPMHRP